MLVDSQDGVRLVIVPCPVELLNAGVNEDLIQAMALAQQALDFRASSFTAPEGNIAGGCQAISHGIALENRVWYSFSHSQSISYGLRNQKM